MGYKALPDHIIKGFKRYVSGAAFVGERHQASPLRVNLGAPAALDADGILNDLNIATANANVITTAFATTYDTVNGLSGRYGRNLTVVASGAATTTLEIRGYDYLGQPMLETFTLNGTTTVQGNKAFKFVSSVKNITGTDAVTVDVGWGNRLGLPFKANGLAMSYEDDVPWSFGTASHSVVTVAGVEAGAGTTAATLTVPFDGWYIGSTYDVTTAQATSAATIDFIYDGTGTAALDFSVPVAAVGLVGGELKATSAWLAVVGGRTITLTSDGGGDTGVITVHAHFAKGKAGAGFQGPVETDPQTATTRDPRGLFIPATACNGTIVYEVDLVPDFDETYGVAHYFA